MKFVAQLAIAFAMVLALGAAAPAYAQVGSALPKNILKNKDKTKQIINDRIIDRLLAMSPRERAQALQQLPLPRRRAALQILQALELLSPEERALLRGRYQLFLGMDRERRQAVRRELLALRALPRQERRRRLASEDLRSRFSEPELQLLYEVMGLPEP